MATFDKRLGGASGHPGAVQSKQPYLIERYVDFSVTTNAVADVFQVIQVPVNTAILLAGAEVVTAGTGTGTLAVSDGTNTWVAAAVVTAAGQMTGAAVTPKIFGTATQVTGTVGTAAVNAVVRFWAVLQDIATYDSLAYHP